MDTPDPKTYIFALADMSKAIANQDFKNGVGGEEPSDGMMSLFEALCEAGYPRYISEVLRKAYDRQYAHATMLKVLVELKARWQDECQYEDIKDYMDVIVKRLLVIHPTATEITPREWGVSFKLDYEVEQYAL